MQFLPWMLIFGSIIIVAHAEHKIEKRNSTNQKKVVCYYTNWSVYRPGTAKFSPQNINPYLCTHLIYAFGGLDKENGLRPYDKYQDIEQGGYAKFNGLKTYNKNLKTLLAIGGWNEGSARFSKLVDDPDKRKEFVKNVIKFLRQNNFDGLDLDWEYPAYRDGSKPSDKENYAFLVKELRDEFNRESSKTGRSRLLLTMAVPAGIEYIDKGYDVPELNKHLDFINLLTYDYHSSYEPAVNHHSPLYPLEEDSEYNFDAKLNIDHTIKHYIAAGADREKLILGIPTYGRSYTLFNKESTDVGAPSDGPGEKGEATREKGYLAYYEICGNLKKDDKWTVEQPKPRAMGPYAYKENQWVGYDDEEFVKLKAKYVNENDLGGIMFWSIDNDDFRGNCHSRPYPLIEAGKEALLGDSKVEPSQEKETKTALKSRPKPRPIARTTTSAPPQEKSAASTTTPEPPTTPDTGTDFTCKDEGFFPHPRECKKYFWCLDSGPSNLGIVAHQFTCPSGLVFNKVSDSCDYSRNVVCKDKKTATETTTTTTTTPKPTKSGIKTTSTTTTSTTTSTTQVPEVEEEVEDEFEEEDPKEIKQLINLIKKLGGVAELEKQLNIKDGSTEVTTPAISKSLYNKVLKRPSNRFQSSYVNGPGPQSEGLDYKDDNLNYKKDKPQYVTIRRQRPSKDVLDNTKEDEEEDTSIDASTERFKPTYRTVERTRYRDLGEIADETSESDLLPKYTTISRTRSTESEHEETTSPKYVTLRRQRPTYKEEESSEDEISAVSTTASTSQAPRYVSLLRQRSTTTSATPVDDRSIETTTRDSYEEPKETKFTKVPTQRTRQRISRPAQRTTTTTAAATTPTPEEPSPNSSTESYASKTNRRRKFRPEYKSTSTSSYEEETTTQRARNPERRFRSRTTALKTPVVTTTTRETLEENDKEFFTSSSHYDDSSLFGKTRDDRKIGGSAEDLANTAVVAIHTLAKAPPSNFEFRPSTHAPQQSVFRETTLKHAGEYDFEPRAPHAKDASYDNARPALLQPAPRQPASLHSQPASVELPPAAFQPAPFQPSPFQPGPFQPLPYPALPFQQQQQQLAVATTAPPAQATSRQTFVLRRGPPPSRTTPLQPAARPTAVPPPQYLNDNARDEQYADYSEPPEQVPNDQRVALKGKVRIHGDGYIECLDMGSFPHPFSCQKFISCAKTEFGSLFGWEYTCPKGLAFDPVGGICNWSTGPACNN